MGNYDSNYNIGVHHQCLSRPNLQALAMPEMEFADDKKGEALYAMELALSLEKLNFQKLRALHAVADKHSDAALCDFIEGDLLQEQVWHSCCMHTFIMWAAIAAAMYVM